MVLINGGSILIGSDKGEDARPNEQPAFHASVKSFWIDRTTVTVSDYRACVKAGKCTADFLKCAPQATYQANGKGNHPINCVSWQDAIEYCKGVSKRLPHLDEWRRARSSISFCQEVGGVCPLFEWSMDPTSLSGYRATRGPSFRYPGALEGSNIEIARNDDLGFRCARDPLTWAP